MGRELGREKQMIRGLEVEAGRCNQMKGSALEIHQVTGGKNSLASYLTKHACIFKMFQPVSSDF